MIHVKTRATDIWSIRYSGHVFSETVIHVLLKVSLLLANRLAPILVSVVR